MENCLDLINKEEELNDIINQYDKAKKQVDDYYKNVQDKLNQSKIDAYIKLSTILYNIKKQISFLELPIELKFSVTDKYLEETIYLIKFDKDKIIVQSKYMPGVLYFKENISKDDVIYINDNIEDKENNKLFLSIIGIYNEFISNLYDNINFHITKIVNNKNNFYNGHIEEYNIYKTFLNDKDIERG